MTQPRYVLAEWTNAGFYTSAGQFRRKVDHSLWSPPGASQPRRSTQRLVHAAAVVLLCVAKYSWVGPRWQPATEWANLIGAV
jgi:hypothetical protein